MSELFLRYLHTQRGRRIIPVQGIAAEFRGGGGGQRKGCPTACLWLRDDLRRDSDGERESCWQEKLKETTATWRRELGQCLAILEQGDLEKLG